MQVRIIGRYRKPYTKDFHRFDKIVEAGSMRDAVQSVEKDHLGFILDGHQQVVSVSKRTAE